MRKIHQKQRHILELEGCVLERRNKVRMTSEKQEQQKWAMHSSNKLTGWCNGFNCIKVPDSRDRPSDRQFPVRHYSLFDNEVWSRDQMRQWYDIYSTPQKKENFNSLAVGYVALPKQNDNYPLPLEKQTSGPQLAKVSNQAKAKSKQEYDIHWRTLASRPFMDFEGNLKIGQARDAMFALQFSTPKGWGCGHNHVAGLRLPPWKEHPPQEAPTYKSPELLKARDTYLQEGGGLEKYKVVQAQTYQRKVAMQEGSGLFSYEE
ncbi:unnamed protein product [Choristocarpus tenellus]